MSVWVGVEVAIEQRLERRDWGDRLGETVSSVLAVLQGPVPHRGQRRVRWIRGGIWMKHISPAVDWCVGLPEVLRTAGNTVQMCIIFMFFTSLPIYVNNQKNSDSMSAENDIV